MQWALDTYSTVCARSMYRFSITAVDTQVQVSEDIFSDYKPILHTGAV